MSTINNLLKMMDQCSEAFVKDFNFYIDSLNEVLHIQGKIGLNEAEMKQLSIDDSFLFKTFLFLAESANTTLIGIIRLMSSNLFSDSYSHMRILYEIACLMHWGNISIENKIELYETIFKSKLSGPEQGKLEWKLIQKAQKQYETEKPGLIDVRKKLNNFGSHISREKIVLGNITSINSASASTLFTNNFGNSHFLMGLEITHLLYNMILEEYAIHLKSYSGATESDLSAIAYNTDRILKIIRPKLHKLIKQ